MWEIEERIIECVGSGCTSSDSLGLYIFLLLLLIIAWGYVKEEND